MSVHDAAGSRRWRTRRPLTAVAGAALVIAGLVVSACGGEASYRYASNRELGNYFKVPASWTLENVTTRDKEGRPDEIDSGVVSLWHTVFDGVADPAGDTSKAVSGTAQIFALSTSYREQLSLSSVRSQVFGGVDPLFAPEELIDTKVRVVSYTPLQTGAGVSGSRVVANLNLSDDDAAPQWVTRDVSLLFDIRKSRVFLLAMGCESQCYLQNRAVIDTVAASWTVRP